MSFNNYKSIGDILQEFPLTYKEENLIKELEVKIDPYFQNRLNFLLQKGIVFNSEYAICENIIYPILVEIWQNYADKLLIWSHQPLNYDENLSGVPDYIIAKRSPRGKIIFDKLYLILMKAKKDKFDEGWGQCLAELIAAQKLNDNIDNPLFGIVTNGKLWEFGVLQTTIFTKNIKYYILEDLSSLMGAINFVFAQSVAII
jgi:hypothetical protein